ncbi:hypothetical protein [Candidatus Nitrosocosmicus arcticus]|uniref:Metallo-beta-lactamase domain-containing protein n=1 Tax=Candidatus Nitrosocosmicus arcticus TaxID=2035267 RepID=A0A557SYV7_9ARCH|nr:hypothetical protein [Candidatus Nitrosocosmicus arcticus]TVP41788.1 hypothetical protein NARC_10194 [Candidatus Nitrosocosmicus arcticus]
MGSISFLIDDNIDNDDKNTRLLFTGDTLFVNGIGRPDLRDSAKEFAENLYNTIQQKFMELSNDLVILPAHFENDFDNCLVTSHNIRQLEFNIYFIKKVNLISNLIKTGFNSHIFYKLVKSVINDK